MTNRIANNLNDRISSILNGLTFNNWCEKVVDEISPKEAPINLQEYFLLRRIKEVRINSQLSFPAMIFIENNEFIIELKYRVKWNNLPWCRFLIAHEIAHTFQYQIQDKLLVQQAFFIPGSSEAEFFSNYLARALLIPRKIIIEQFSDAHDLNNIASLQLFNELVNQFSVEYKVLLARLINDLDFITNVVFLRFVNLKEVSSWKLMDSYRSNKYHKNVKFYIPPQPIVNKEIINKSYISCGEKLGLYLTSICERIPYNSEIETPIPAESLFDNPLLTFMKNFRNSVFRHCYITKKKSIEGDVINMLIKL